MQTWHTCHSTHCRAGWVITLAGEAGRALELAYNSTSIAALKIYRANSPLPVALSRFYDSNEDALEDMRRLAAAEAQLERMRQERRQDGD